MCEQRFVSHCIGPIRQQLTKLIGVHNIHTDYISIDFNEYKNKKYSFYTFRDKKCQFI